MSVYPRSGEGNCGLVTKKAAQQTLPRNFKRAAARGEIIDTANRAAFIVLRKHLALDPKCRAVADLVHAISDES